MSLGWCCFPSVDFKVPFKLAEHRPLPRIPALRGICESLHITAPPGGLREHCLSIAIDSGNASSGGPVGRGAQGTARFLRGERPGVLSLVTLSLHKQRKVTRPRCTRMCKSPAGRQTPHCRGAQGCARAAGAGPAHGVKAARERADMGAKAKGIATAAKGTASP